MRLVKYFESKECHKLKCWVSLWKILSKFLWKILAKFLCKILRKCVSLKERSPFLSGALDRRVDETRKRVGKGREGTDGVCYYCLVGRRASMYIVVPHQSHFGLNSHRTSRLSSNPRKRGNFQRHFTTFPSKRKKLFEWVVVSISSSILSYDL